jgi:hypothetical protein
MAPVTENDIMQALHGVPEQEWGSVLNYVVSLQSAGNESNDGGTGDPIVTAAELARSEIIGLWTDRTEISDSREFARQLRDMAQQR